MNTKVLTYDVIRHIGTFFKKDNYSKELNIVSWNGRQPVYDIRGWRVNAEGEKHPLKGLSMSKDDLIALKLLLSDLEV